MQPAGLYRAARCIAWIKLLVLMHPTVSHVDASRIHVFPVIEDMLLITDVLCEADGINPLQIGGVKI
jgi:hypothetical protein